MNQLQKDLEIALEWFNFIPYGNQLAYKDVYDRLKWYTEQDLGGYETYTGDDLE